MSFFDPPGPALPPGMTKIPKPPKVRPGEHLLPLEAAVRHVRKLRSVDQLKLLLPYIKDWAADREAWNRVVDAIPDNVKRSLSRAA